MLKIVMLSDSQLKFIADVLIAMGQVFLASLVVQYFVAGLDNNFLFSGVTLTLGSWVAGLITIKKVNI